MKFFEKNNVHKKITITGWCGTLLSLLSFCMLVGCSDTKKPEEAVAPKSSIETDERKTAEEETQYPLLLTPTLTSTIEFAVFSEDIFCIYNGEKYGYMTKSGEEITGYIYDAAFPFSEGLACVMQEGKYGYIDTEGQEAIPCIYDDAAPFMEGLAYFSAQDKYGFMTGDGEAAFYLDCDSVSSFQEGLAYISIGGKYGYIDQSGQIVIAPIYHDADYFENGLALINKEGYKGAINASGKEVIPAKYGNLYRQEGYIVAETGEEKDYYSLEGSLIPKEQVEKEMFSKSEGTADSGGAQELNEPDFYKVEFEKGIRLLDKSGNEVLSVSCDYDAQDIYGDYKNSILKQYGGGTDRILLIEENEAIDVSDLLLKNSITPRIEQYWLLTHGKDVDVINTEQELIKMKGFASWEESNYIKKAKLFSIEQLEEPVLYCYEEQIILKNFPLSKSALYTVEDDRLHRLVAGAESGGSSRGDYVCFWKAAGKDEIFIGTRGAAGGFGGYSSYSSVYTVWAKEVQRIHSLVSTSQASGNYKQEELLENAHLFYDDNNIPYTKEIIQKADYVNEYLLNGERVTVEEYEKACEEYRYMQLF